MKRWILLILIVCLLAAGCGKPDEPETVSRQTETETDPAEEVLPEPDATDYAALLDEQYQAARTAEEAELSFLIKNGEATVTCYTGPGGAVRIPETLGGATVTAIADGAFSGMDHLTALCLPGSVRTFGEGILRDTPLTFLRTPLPTEEGKGFLGFLYGVKAPGDNSASAALRNLRYLDLIGVESIADRALFDCNKLVAVRLSGEIRSVGSYAFYACESLRWIGTVLLEEVGEHAFEGCSALTRMTFSSLNRMGFAALQDCDALIELTLPFVGESAGEQTFLAWLFGAENVAFSGGFYPPQLTTVVLTKTESPVPEIPVTGIEALPPYAFYECESLRSVTLPDTLTSIGARAFSGCKGLRSITLPDSVRTVGDAAFAGCSSLRECVSGDGVSFGVNAFSGCPLKK